MKIKNFFSENNNSLQRPYIIAEAGVNREGSVEVPRLILKLKKAMQMLLNFRLLH